MDEFAKYITAVLQSNTDAEIYREEISLLLNKYPGVTREDAFVLPNEFNEAHSS